MKGISGKELCRILEQNDFYFLNRDEKSETQNTTLRVSDITWDTYISL
jgi:hypothetical protein